MSNAAVTGASSGTVTGSDSFDYVIVGAGSAGCVLANRLTEDPSARVLLLEAGGEDSLDAIKVPAAFGSLFQSDVDWAYEIDQQRHAAGSTYWPRGKTLGGSSSINLMIYSRGNPADYDGWRESGATGWDYDSVLPYFVKAEQNSRLGAPLHGKDGPLHVEDRLYRHELSEAWVRAAVDWGMRPNDDFNGAEQDGVGQYQVTCHQGRRWSTADAYLRPALDRPNLTVRTRAFVTRILFDGLRAEGVTYRQEGVQWSVRADTEVLLSGGAVNSPHLLLLSGVGPAEHVGEYGIDVVVNLPGVGENLHDHPMVPLVWATRNTTDLLDLASPQNMERWQRGEGGPFASNGGEAGGFFATRPDLPAPDVQFVAGPTGFINHGLTRPPMPVFTSLAALTSPLSRGRLRLASADPDTQPRLDPAYYDQPDDLETMKAGLRALLSIAGHEPLAGFLDKPFLHPRDDLSDAELAAHIRQWTQTEYHPVGTCAMGTGERAVVDPQLNVHGVEGLRVVDASVMPAVPRGNTNAPTIMVAEKATDLIRAGR